MDIGPTLFQIVSNLSPTPNRSLPNLQVGQLLNILVMDKPSANTAVVSVAGTKLTALTDAPLSRGQSVSARVEHGGAQPILRVVHNESTARTEVLNQALRTVLPKQVPLAEGLSTLPKLTPETIQALPGPVRHAVSQVIQSATTPTQLSDPKQLATIIRTSGLFLEAHLKQLARDPGAVSLIGTDTKARLLKLVDVITKAIDSRASRPPSAATPTPRAPGPSTLAPDAQSVAPMIPEPTLKSAHRPTTGPGVSDPSRHVRPETVATLESLMKGAERSLARVETNQIQTLKGSDSAQPVWHLDLPVMVEHELRTLSLRIRKETLRGGEQPLYTWSVDVEVDLAALGELQARVTLSGGNVGAIFWLDNAATTELVRGQLDRLQESLKDAGLRVDHLNCHHGQPPRPATTPCEQILAAQA